MLLDQILQQEIKDSEIWLSREKEELIRNGLHDFDFANPILNK